MIATGVQCYLLDTGVVARMAQAAVVSALSRLEHHKKLVIAPPIALEIGFSARNAAGWTATMRALERFESLPLSRKTEAVALNLQESLWLAGKARAAGSFDTLVAAIALEHDACIVHYDRDYEHLASVCGDLRTQWIVPPGSIS